LQLKFKSKNRFEPVPNLIEVGVDPEAELAVAGADDQTRGVHLKEVVVLAGPRVNLKKVVPF